MLVLNTTKLAHDARVLKEALALAEDGHRVSLIALSRAGEARPNVPSVNLVLLRLWSRGLGHNAAALILKYVEFCTRAFFWMLRARADVYHAHDLDALVPTYAAARLLRALLIYDAHELYAERAIPLRRFWRSVDRFLVRRVDRMIAANEERADVVRDEYGAPLRPLVLMNCPEATKATVTRTLRSSLPVAQRHSFVVVYQGGLAPGRGLDRLVSAMAWCDPEVVLALVGSPSMYSRGALANQVRACRLENRVFFLPPVDFGEVTAFISDADVGVVSYEDTSRNNYLCAPNKLFEYCAAGLAVVGCAFPPIVRVMREFPLGGLFDVADPTSIAHAISVLSRDRQALAAARSAAAAAARRFSWNVEKHKLTSLYRQLGVRRRDAAAPAIDGSS